MTKLEELNEAVSKAQEALDLAKNYLLEYLVKPENNTFTDLEVASYKIEMDLEDRASNACEGSYRRGPDEYIQLFYVNDSLYKGTLKVEYNRHDKTYYYIDGTDFLVEEVRG